MVDWIINLIIRNKFRTDTERQIRKSENPDFSKKNTLKLYSDRVEENLFDRQLQQEELLVFEKERNVAVTRNSLPIGNINAKAESANRQLGIPSEENLSREKSSLINPIKDKE